MTSLEHLARTLALARHGTDAMWANYLTAAEAVEKMMNDDQSLRDQMEMALKAFADTFDTGFFVGSPVRLAAWKIQERNGGKTVEERVAEQEAFYAAQENNK